MSSEISPNGCIRVDTYSAFRVLPSVFHRIPHPDPSLQVGFAKRWHAAVFDRAYEASTGAFLGETIVYDPSSTFDYVDCGDTGKTGRRLVNIGGFMLADTTRCSDAATMARIEAFYERKRNEIQTSEKNREDQRRLDAGPLGMTR
ncbi:hypothetical protein [Luteibacter sp. 22Crub2.1]|uniref:hypothetical protein n=1 Tax=Luteibacter sp. 22Crub2.1 TaxID=1283288 RepID=UPI0011170DBA|nr:hypothetical protein [Luteibacter sp. 22Crub2.1]